MSTQPTSQTNPMNTTAFSHQVIPQSDLQMLVSMEPGPLNSSDKVAGPFPAS